MKKQSSTKPVNIPLLNINRKLLENGSQAENNDNIKLPKNRQQAYGNSHGRPGENIVIVPGEKNIAKYREKRI